MNASTTTDPAAFLAEFDVLIHLDQLEEQFLRFSSQIHLPDDLTLRKLHRLS